MGCTTSKDAAVGSAANAEVSSGEAPNTPTKKEDATSKPTSPEKKPDSTVSGAKENEDKKIDGRNSEEKLVLHADSMDGQQMSLNMTSQSGTKADGEQAVRAMQAGKRAAAAVAAATTRASSPPRNDFASSKATETKADGFNTSARPGSQAKAGTTHIPGLASPGSRPHGGDSIEGKEDSHATLEEAASGEPDPASAVPEAEVSGVITEVAVKGRDGGDAAADDPWAALQSDYAADGALGGGEAAGTAGGEEVMVLDDETGDATVMAATGASRLATPPLQSDVQPGTTRGGWGEEEDEGADQDMMARSGRANAGAATAVAGQELEIEDINELEELEDV